MPRLLLLISSLALLVPVAHAAPTPYSVDGLEVEFVVPLTIGSHDGTIEEIAGSLTITPGDLAKTHGTLVAPIASFDTGNRKRDCHLRESLGIDYVKSAFPDSHVCDGKRLPADAIAFPEVTFVIDGLRPGEDANVWFVDGSVTVHGVPKLIGGQDVAFTLERTEDDRYSVRGEWVVSLQEHGVIVKNVPFIKVQDKVTVQIDGEIAPQR